MVRSSLAVAKVWPSGVNTTERMSAVCPLSERRRRPVSMSHSRTSRSTPPLARVKLSGAKATDQTPCEWPRNVVSSRAAVFQYSRKSTDAESVPDADGVSGEEAGPSWDTVGSAMFNHPYGWETFTWPTATDSIANRLFRPV